jgi:uncharacterized protein
MEWLTEARWSPYVVGAGIGVLSWLTWLISSKPLGCSTTFARTAGMIEQAVRGRGVSLRPYFKDIAPVVDWQWMLVVGMVIGAFISAVISGDFKPAMIPSRWALAFGDDGGLRLAVALAGGVLMGFGSRWADGCTSGHGISGTMQLAISSWVSAVCFFIGGIVAAQVIFRLIA